MTIKKLPIILDQEREVKQLENFKISINHQLVDFSQNTLKRLFDSFF